MQPLPCPACRQTMQKLRCERTQGGTLWIDLCYPCQGLWFDAYESLQIAPGALIDLFRELHARRDSPRQPWPSALRCPRCAETLLHGMDLAKPGGRFNYERCLQGHGRFIPFSQFLIEKGFVRQLSSAEVQRLAADIRQIRCNGCGSPIDLPRDAVCPHCRAPVALLDPGAVDAALARYRDAEARRLRPLSPEALGDPIVARERERSRQARRAPANPANDLGVIDLLVDGAGFLLRLLD